MIYSQEYIDWLVSTTEWFTALDVPWWGYCLGAVLTGGLILAVGLGLIASGDSGEGGE